MKTTWQNKIFTVVGRPKKTNLNKDFKCFLYDTTGPEGGTQVQFSQCLLRNPISHLTKHLEIPVSIFT